MCEKKMEKYIMIMNDIHDQVKYDQYCQDVQDHEMANNFVNVKNFIL